MRPAHYVNIPRRRQVKLHEGWLEHKSSQDSKWKWIWCTLRGNVIYIFRNETDIHEQHIGTLSLDLTSRFEKKDGDDKTGYRFDLHTGRRMNKFRTKKFSDREQWRAFLEGVAKGFVSNDVDLPEKLIEDIRKTLNSSLTEEATPPASQSRQNQRRGSTGGITYGFETPEFPPDNKSKFHTMHYLQPVKRPLPNIPPPSPPAPHRDSTCAPYPLTREFVFYTDASKRDIPCWFFKDCSRDLAMEVLIKAAKHGWGNTLMRSRPNNDKHAIVISKLGDKGGSNEFSHYEVHSVPGGYIIVLDEPHKPETSLEGLMEFFKLRSGSLTTKFLTCNDLRRLGVETDSPDGYPYMRSIANVQLDHESGEQLDQSSSESGYLSAPSKTPSSLDSKGGSAEGSFSSAFSSNDSSQHLVPNEPPIPPPPPIPTFSTLPRRGNQTEPSSLVSKPPASVSESTTKICRSQSSVSQESEKAGPAVRPKPFKKTCSFDEGVKSETETDLHPTSKDLETETSYTIVYADIKKSTSFESSLNGCFQYINCKTKYGENVEESRHCMEWKSEEDLITYIEMNQRCALIDWEKFEEIYEPIENPHFFCKENLISLEAKPDVTNIKNNGEISFEDNEVETEREAEILETFNQDITDIVKYENLMEDLDCDIFQTINFHQNCLGSENAKSGSTIEECEHIVEETYELFNEKSSDEASANDTLNAISKRKFRRESSSQAQHSGKRGHREKREEGYETMHIKSNYYVPAPYPLGISPPMEIYEGFECKSDLKHRPRAPSPIFQREQRRTLSEKKSLGCSDNLSITSSSWDETYDEVQQMAATDSPINNYYIDIIASYEDIRAMKLQSNWSTQSSSYKQKKKNFLKLRSKSENNCLAVNGGTPSNFMRELQGVLKGQGQGPLRRLSSQIQQIADEDPYENIEEIKKNMQKM